MPHCAECAGLEDSKTPLKCSQMRWKFLLQQLLACSVVAAQHSSVCTEMYRKREFKDEIVPEVNQKKEKIVMLAVKL